MKSRSMTGLNSEAYLYLLPWLIGIISLQVYPFLISLYYSLCEYNPLRNAAFIGIKNYIELFTKDPEFWIS